MPLTICLFIVLISLWMCVHGVYSRPTWREHSWFQWYQSLYKSCLSADTAFQSSQFRLSRGCSKITFLCHHNILFVKEGVGIEKAKPSLKTWCKTASQGTENLSPVAVTGKRRSSSLLPWFANCECSCILSLLSVIGHPCIILKQKTES